MKSGNCNVAVSTFEILKQKQNKKIWIRLKTQEAS